MAQRFIAREKHEFANGAIGWRPGGPFDCVGPYAKVQNCPVMLDGVEILRRTCYATSPARDFFSVPACTKVLQIHIGGFFTTGDKGPEFHAHGKYREQLRILAQKAKRTPGRPSDKPRGMGRKADD